MQVISCFSFQFQEDVTANRGHLLAYLDELRYNKYCVFICLKGVLP